MLHPVHEIFQLDAMTKLSQEANIMVTLSAIFLLDRKGEAWRYLMVLLVIHPSLLLLTSQFCYSLL